MPGHMTPTKRHLISYILSHPHTRERYQSYRKRIEPRTQGCSICRQPGHNIKTCPCKISTTT